MLDRVIVRGYRVLVDVDLALTPLTVVVGANGTGKTTLLDLLDEVCSAAHEPPENRVFGAFDDVFEPKAGGSSHTSGLDIPTEVEIRPGSDNALTATVRRGPGPFHVRFTLARRYGEETVTLDLSGGSQRSGLFFADGALKWIPRALRLEMDRWAIGEAADIESDQPEVDFMGQGVPAVLAWLAINDRPAYEAIQANLSLVVPTFQGLYLERVKLNDEWTARGGRPREHLEGKNGWAVRLEMHGAGRLPADAVSEGTLLALCLFTALYGPTRPNLLLLDDIDRGLHPSAQVRLVGVLRQIMSARPDLQIIVTTHSPYLVDAVSPREVQVLALDGAGHAHSRPLTSHPEFERWEGMLRTGELWSTFAESWVVEPPDAG